MNAKLISECGISVIFQAKKVQELFGRVDILVNNAGIVFGNSFVDSVPEEVNKTVSVNTLGQIWVSLYLILNITLVKLFLI